MGEPRLRAVPVRWPATWTRSRGLLAVVVVAVAIMGARSCGIAATSGAVSSPSASVFVRGVTASPGVVGPAGHIKHVVVFYQENHSFDETLGRFCQLHTGRCDGYTGPVRLKDRTVVRMKQSPDIVPDVSHTVRAQRQAIDGGKMDGWARFFGCKKLYGYRCLTFYAPKQIPNLTALASHFVVSDRTFSMMDSPSWGGHIYAAAATLDNFTGENPTRAPGVTPGPGWGCNSNLVTPWRNPTTRKISMQPSCIPARRGTLNPTKYPNNGAFRATPARYVPTIFDRLDAKHLSWKLYASARAWSICPSFAECEYTHQHRNIVPTSTFLSDAVNNRLPSYSVLLPNRHRPRTSQHNTTSMLAGDNWIGRVLSTLEHSPEWSSTAVFITYDDCGCFYDHVRPGTNPDGSPQGIRVPMVIVSPYAKVAHTDSHPATFASILRFTEETFGLAALSVNDRRAYDYANAFSFAARATGPRVLLRQHALSAPTQYFLAAHPADGRDPT